MPIAPVTVPFDVIGMDCIGPLTKTSSGNESAIVFTDYCTRFVIIRALPNIETTTIIKAFEEAIIYTHSVPVKLITDRGTNFCSHAFSQFCYEQGIVKYHTTSYSPRSNGLTERLNRSLKTVLRAYITDQSAQIRPELDYVRGAKTPLHPDKQMLEWDQLLPRVAFNINSQVNGSIGEMPFYLVYGKVPRLSWGLCIETTPRDETLAPSQDVVRRIHEERIRSMQHAWYIANWALILAQRTQKRNYDRGVTEHKFSVGDTVLVCKDPKRKVKIHETPFTGPYRILRITKSGKAATVQCLETLKIGPMSIDRIRMAPNSLHRHSERHDREEDEVSAE